MWVTPAFVTRVVPVYKCDFVKGIRDESAFGSNLGRPRQWAAATARGVHGNVERV